MPNLMVDFITSLDGYAAAEGWPGYWGLQGPEYLEWLDRQADDDHIILMGANTYRLMSGFAADSDDAGLAELTARPKVVFSSTLQAPPVVTGSSGQERIYDGWPDVALEMVASRTFDGRLQLLEFVPTVLAGAPGTGGPTDE